MKKELIVLFILLVILSYPNLGNLCRDYMPLFFDNQVLFTWEYSSFIGQFPYRDIFYPYGLLSYYRIHNIFITIIYLLIAPILLTGFFIFLQRIFRERLFSYLTIFALLIFIASYTGFGVFTRYGTTALVACLFAYVLYSYKKYLSRKLVFGLGVLGGVIMPFLNDQGIYIGALFCGFLVIDTLLRNKIRIPYKKFKLLCINAAIFSAGYLLALLPFFTYLFFNNSFFQFFTSIKELSDLEETAKTPYFHSAATPDNLFTLAALFITICFLTYKVFYRKQQLSLNNYTQIGLVLTLIIFEQKSLMRHTSMQLTFMGFLLYVMLFYEIKIQFEKYKISKFKILFYYLNILFVAVFFFGLRYNIYEKGSIPCPDQRRRYEVTSEKHLIVKKELQKSKDFNGSIFSFPGDTIFYMLFKQEPPYYPSTFEASSIIAQERLIAYMQKKKVGYVIYDHKNIAIQDEVPDIVRVPVLNKYIFNNYSIDKEVGDFLLLRKNKNDKDFFSDKELNGLPKFKRLLLEINLENIPRSEGLYKQKYLTGKLVSYPKLEQINEYLKTHEVRSNNLVLAIDYQTSSQKFKSVVYLHTKEGYKTRIEFKDCSQGKPCILNVSNLPLFYKNRTIKKISVQNGDTMSSFSLYQVDDKKHLW